MKENKETEKLVRRRLEFPLLQRCKELGLTEVVPHSKAGQLYSLLKSELVSLCTKLGLEADCKKICKKKFSNLNRTELGDYLLTKIKDTELVDNEVEIPSIAASNLVTESYNDIPMIKMQSVLPVVVEEVANGTAFNSWEEINEYLHRQYGFGAEIEQCVPNRADIVGLNRFYVNGSEDDRYILDSSWYRHPQFQLHN